MSTGTGSPGVGNHRDLPRFLAGIAVETLYTLALVAMGALVILVLRVLPR
jgi:hypothetical protein